METGNKREPSNAPLLLVQGDSSQSCDGKLAINKGNLSCLLAPISNKPVSVISIIGPPSNGKSLLFGYIARYLLAAEMDEFDWMDWNNSEKPMTEFQWPNEGKSPNFPGIWAFPRPFMLECGEGVNKQVAVLLLYTQLPPRNSWRANINDVATLMGLALSISSTTVFNIHKQLDEQFLSSIGGSIKYAVDGSRIMTTSTKKGVKPLLPLQNASFLIRDWSFPSQFKYGCSEGLIFVKSEILKTGTGNHKQCRQSRQLINSLFENISGCLLPFPGSQVIDPDEFRGSIGEMDQDFAKHLEDFIGHLINLDDLIIKTGCHGESITGMKLKDLMEKYVSRIEEIKMDSLDTNRILKKFGIKVSISPADQKEGIKPALKKYADAWKKYEKSKNFLDEKKLQSAHKKALKKAQDTLKNEVCPAGHEDDSDDDGGSFKISESVKKRLNERIIKRFKEITAENLEKKKAFVEQCKVELLQQYKDSMMAIFPQGRKPSEVAFRRESKGQIEQLKGELSNKIGEIGDKGVMCQQMEIFLEWLAEEETNLHVSLFGNQNTRKLGENGLHGNSDASNLPTVKGNLSSSRRKVDTESMFSKSSGYSDVSQSVSLCSLKDDDIEIPKTRNRSEKNTRKSKDQQKKENEALKEKAKQLVHKLKEEHTENLEAQVERDVDDLQGYHKDEVKKLLEQFEDESPYSTEMSEYALYYDILKDELNMVYSGVNRKQKSSKQREEATVLSAIKSILKDYSLKMEEFTANHRGFSDEQLQETHEDLEKVALATLKEKVGMKAYPEAADKVKEQMDETFEKYHGEIKKKTVKSQNASVEKSLSLISSYKSEYSKSMKDLAKSVSSENELRREHEMQMEDLVQKFKSKSTVKESPDILLDHVSQLKKSLTVAYSEARDLLGLVQRNHETSAKVSVREARQFYCQEMDKHMKNDEHAFKKDVEKIHKKTCEAAKKKFQNVDVREMEKALKIAFQKYKDEVEMGKDKEPAIGIDLGTTYSCVSVYQKGKVVIIPNSVGKLTTPSYVLLQSKDKDIVGEPAKMRAYENPEATIFDAKRILGRKFDDPKLQEDMKLWPFTVVDGGHGVPLIEANGEKMHPEFISSKILKQLKLDAEKYLSRKVDKAVITVPAYFTDGQKQATIDAGKMAGLTDISILTEPVAAAMAYKLQYADNEDEGDGGRHILIFDLGGGTFDVAVLKVSQGRIEVLTVDGDTHLGGEDFDKNLMNYCAQEFKKEHKVDLFEGKDSSVKKTRDDVRRRLKRLQGECERQKIALTTARSVDVSVDNFYKNVDLEVTITKATFDKINKNLFDTTIKVVENALQSAKLNKNKINDVVLVGGSTRIPKVQELLQDYFGGKELDKKINPDEAVAHGAGLMAAIRRGNVEKTSKAFTKIQDVTPMSIGVEVYGGGFSVIIPKSTKIPVMLKERYKTAHNNQTSVQITIYEGEKQIAKQNQKLGDFYLNGIPPKNAGVENIDVEMVINKQGILHITAKCSSTGSKNTVTVTENKQRMGQAAIERYLAQA